MKKYPSHRDIDIQFIECEIFRQQGYIYLRMPHSPKQGDFFFDQFDNLQHCRYVKGNITGIKWIETDQGDEIPDILFSFKTVVASNDPLLRTFDVPLMPKLWDKLESIKVKMEAFNWRPDVYGGTALAGEYRYDLRPILTEHGYVITSF